MAVTFIVAGCGGGDAPEGVTGLAYSPKPFYDDLETMSVSFTTTGPARSGFQYVATYSITGPDVDALKCAFIGFSDKEKYVVSDETILGEAGRTYTVDFKPVGLTDDFPAEYFCHGRVDLTVTSVSIDNPSKETSRRMAELEFRVLTAP